MDDGIGRLCASYLFVGAATQFRCDLMKNRPLSYTRCSRVCLEGLYVNIATFSNRTLSCQLPNYQAELLEPFCLTWIMLL